MIKTTTICLNFSYHAHADIPEQDANKPNQIATTHLNPMIHRYYNIFKQIHCNLKGNGTDDK